MQSPWSWQLPGPCQLGDGASQHNRPQGCPASWAAVSIQVPEGLPPCSFLPGGRTPGHVSFSVKGGTRLQPSTAGGQEVLPELQPHDSVPSGADEHGPEPCGVAPGEGKRKVTSELEKGSGSRTPAGSQQSPTGDGDQLVMGSRESCEPSSALPGMVGSAQSTGTPVATDTLHSPGPAVCGSNEANTRQNLPLPTSDARTGGGSPPPSPSSTQPEASRADMPQIPLGPGACTSPGPPAPLTDGAGASPGPMALLTDGVGASPEPMAPLTDEAGASPGPTAALTPEEAGSSHMALLTLEEAGSGPVVPLTPKEARISPTAPVTPEEARSSPMALTLEEARTSPTALLTPEKARSSPTAPLTLGEVRMLVELFYLPYHHGPLAQHLLEHFRWLWANGLSVGVPATAPDACRVRLVRALLRDGACHSCTDTWSIHRACSGAAEPSPSSCSALRRAASTAASSAALDGRCSTTSTPTSGTSATCCWPPVPSSSGWVRG